MQLASPSRRVLGLLAAGALVALSTVAGAGVAHAEPGGFDTTDGTTEYVVPAGICAVSWQIIGGGGGADVDDNPADLNRETRVTTFVSEAQVFTLATGSAGASAAVGSAAGTNGAYPAADGGPGDGTNGGGGGAASVVLDGDGQVYLYAYGMNGAGVDMDHYGYGGTVDGVGTGAEWIDPDSENFSGDSDVSGIDGRIIGFEIPCGDDGGGGGNEDPTPLAPYDVSAWAGDGELTVAFYENYAEASVDSWEYKVGAGDWTPVEVQDNGNGGWAFTLDGLTNGQTYTVRVRGVNEDSGAGDPSDAVTATPYRPIGAPASVDATAGPAEVTITWTAPEAAGTFDLAGYEAVLMATFENHGGEIYTCETDADVRSCTVPAMPGDFDYAGVVYAVDTEGNRGEGEGAEVGPVPAPAAVPASDGTLEAPPATTGGVVAGEKVTFSGTGYAPFSTVTLLVYSEPQILGTVMTDEDGAFTVTVTLPAGLAAGSHTLVAAGLDPSGEMRYMTLPITVVEADTLALTGFDVQAPLTGGLLALGIGTALIVVSRRRVSA